MRFSRYPLSHQYILAFLGLALFLPQIEAYPHPQDASVSTLASRNGPQSLSLPRRRLLTRVPGTQGWDTSITMRRLHFQALAAILPVSHAASELYVVFSMLISSLVLTELLVQEPGVTYPLSAR